MTPAHPRKLDELRAIHTWYAQHMRDRYNLSEEGAKAVTKLNSRPLRELLSLLPRVDQPSEVTDLLDEQLLNMTHALTRVGKGGSVDPWAEWQLLDFGVARNVVGHGKRGASVLKLPRVYYPPSSWGDPSFHSRQTTQEISQLAAYGGRKYKVSVRDPFSNEHVTYNVAYPKLIYAPEHEGYLVAERINPTPWQKKHSDAGNTSVAAKVGEVLGVDDVHSNNMWQQSPNEYVLLDLGIPISRHWQKTTKGRSKSTLKKISRNPLDMSSPRGAHSTTGWRNR